jgi:HEAT repeat protein
MRKMFYGVRVTTTMTLVVLTLARSSASAEGEFEGWHLEPALSQAQLVIVARLTSIGDLTIVEGAKTDVALREYRYQPVRRLKGIFQREQLSMTAADLGFPAGNTILAPPLQGEYRLLILAQQQGRYSGCVSVAPGTRTFNERVPVLTGPDDPLVLAVETLIQVSDRRSRHERARLLVERLADVDGLAAVPLLSSLRLRADWAATDPRAFATVARLARDPATPVRSAALDVLRDMLASGSMPSDRRQLDDVAGALQAIFAVENVSTRVRLAALEALGHLIALKKDIAWPRELLIALSTRAETHAERAAAINALTRITHPDATSAVLDALTTLPLDESPARESVYIGSAVRLDAARAERVLLARFERSIVARQSLEAEIEALGRMRSKDSLPLLLHAANQLDVLPKDRYKIAWALGRLGDDRAVVVLASWLRGDDHQLKELALAALENLDSPVAAGEVRALIRTEAHLPFKLRLARIVARQGFGDGYALASEHLADVDHTASATLVLVALNDPRTTSDLSAIVATQPDRRWHAAALTGLAATGDATARAELLEILTDDRHPMVADAAQAAGLTDDDELLVPLATLAQSRNRQIALTSLVALRRFFSDVRSSPQGLAAIDMDQQNRDDAQSLEPAAPVPLRTRAIVADAVASLAMDVYVEANVREEAFAVAQRLRGEGFSQLLTDLADQAELEGTSLLAEVQSELQRSRRSGQQP